MPKKIMKKENRSKQVNERILAQGITVSNDTLETGFNNNDMIIGSSGTGKTGGYVIPNIQSLNGSLVVTDTKRNLCRKFSKSLEERGYKVWTLDFVDPLKSCGYNPLQGIRRYKDGNYREQDVLSLAHTIMPTLDEKEPFWEKAAAGYIAFLIAYVLEALPEEEQNMHSVCELRRGFLNPQKVGRLEKWFVQHPDGFAAKKYMESKATFAADKMWSSISEFVNRALEPFEFREARYIFSENPNQVDIKSLGKEKTVLFLNVSDTDRTYDAIVNCFFTQTLQLLCAEADENESGRLEIPVRIIMDDFATSARIPDFDKVISVIRSREISVSLILQSLTQLESMYGKSVATTIINNCDHLLYLGSQDRETAEFIGLKAYKIPEAVLCMPRDKAYLLTNGEKAKLVDKIKPYSTIFEKQEKMDYEAEQ